LKNGKRFKKIYFDRSDNPQVRKKIRVKFFFKNCVFEKSIFEKINREECVEKC